MSTTLESARVRLRQWDARDRAPFARLNADPRVMRYYPAPLESAESDALADKCAALIAQHGWGFWACEQKASNTFLGFVGLHRVEGLPFSPAIEIGWRLAHEYWGYGYATEAAQTALAFAFEHLKTPEVVSFAVVDNLRSRAVMERLGMRESGRFEHPRVPEGPLKTHVLYRLAGAEWRPAPAQAAP